MVNAQNFLGYTNEEVDLRIQNALDKQPNNRRAESFFNLLLHQTTVKLLGVEFILKKLQEVSEQQPSPYRHCHLFVDLPEQVQAYLLTTDPNWTHHLAKKYLPRLSKTIQYEVLNTLPGGSFIEVLKMHPTLFPSYYQAYELFKQATTLQLCQSYDALLHDHKPMFGLHSAKELQAYIKKQELAFATNKIDYEKLMQDQDSLYTISFKAYARFGPRTNDDADTDTTPEYFTKKITAFLETKDNLKNPKHESTYSIASEKLVQNGVNKADLEQREQSLKTSIDIARNWLSNADQASHAIDSIQQQIIADSEALSRNAEDNHYIRKQVQELESINPHDWDDVGKVISYMLKDRQLKEQYLLPFIIWWYAQLHEKQELIHGLDTTEQLITFMDDVKSSPFLQSFFKSISKKAFKSFKQVLNTTALKESLEDHSYLNKKEVTFSNQPCLLNEFSGYLADTCWADTYDCIQQTFPNLETILMHMNGQCIGAGLLLHEILPNGQPITIIRGLNPRQNYIEQLNVEDFCTKYFHFIRENLPLENTLAIVIDPLTAEGTEQKATNRPKINQYLNTIQDKLTKIELPINIGVFNGAIVANQVYELPEGLDIPT
jgi:hypothetical protein